MNIFLFICLILNCSSPSQRNLGWCTKTWIVWVEALIICPVTDLPQHVLFFSYTAVDQRLSKISTTMKCEILKRKQTSNWQSDQKPDLLQMIQCLGVTMQARSCAILAKIISACCHHWGQGDNLCPSIFPSFLPHSRTVITKLSQYNQEITYELIIRKTFHLSLGIYRSQTLFMLGHGFYLETKSPLLEEAAVNQIRISSQWRDGTIREGKLGQGYLNEKN